ncbi:MAG: DUF2341 domain-containing protein [Candidatus Parcubacteria bacterium]|nr:DUF2341 domain-containing protein [Candidatus Parcubacteria bacterium]
MGKLKFALILILVLASAANFSLFPPEDVFAGWISGWGYRKPVTITNSGSALSDYQVLVALNTSSLVSAGKMKSDCGDVRFTDSDGSTQLNYWIESGCNSADTKVWVKVPSVPVGSKIIYLYYGNPAASSASNGTATFVFFDNFDNLNNWSSFQRSNLVTVTSLISASVNEMRHINGSDWYGSSAWTNNNFTKESLSLDYDFQAPQYSNIGACSSTFCDTPFSFYFRNSVESRETNYYATFSGPAVSFQVIPQKSPVEWNINGSAKNTSVGFAAGTWYSINFNVFSDGTVKVYKDGSLLIATTVNLSSISSYKIEFHSGNYSTTDDLSIRKVRLRKIASIEPTTGAGSEEVPTSSPILTTQAASLVEATTAIGNGTITATGGLDVTRRGFAYMVGTSGDPTTGNSVSYDDGSFGIGSYTKTIAGLSPGTNYRVRAYAVNSGGTGYGTTVQILTKPNYGVSVESSNDFTGWAWGSNVFGWISFNCANQGVCATSNYKVSFSNRGPDQPAGSGETWDNCSIQKLSIPTFSWVYSDFEGDPQGGYEVWVDDNSAFSGTKFNFIAGLSASNSYRLDLSQDAEGDWLSQLSWGTSYYWKVRVKDNNDNWAPWSNAYLFTMPSHAYPWVSFTPNPVSPSAGEQVRLIQNTPGVAQSICYDAFNSPYSCQDGSQISYAWDFPSANPSASAIKGNTTTTYSALGTYQATLKITDTSLPGADNYCSKPRTINIGVSFPRWQEIIPNFF